MRSPLQPLQEQPDNTKLLHVALIVTTEEIVLASDTPSIRVAGFQFVSKLGTSWARATHNDLSDTTCRYRITCMGDLIARVCKLMKVSVQSWLFTSTQLLPISLLITGEA
jgi:hypothetical protein